MLDVVKGIERLSAQQDNLVKSIQDTQARQDRAVSRLHSRLDGVDDKLEAINNTDNIQEERIAMLEESTVTLQESTTSLHSAINSAKTLTEAVKMLSKGIVIFIIVLAAVAGILGGDIIESLGKLLGVM